MLAYGSVQDGRSTIRMIRIDGEGEFEVTQDFDNAKFPACSPDGSKLYFTSVDPLNQKNSEIWVIDLDSRIATQLTTYRGEDVHPSISPDGKYITWLSTQPRGWLNVWIMNADGTEQRQLTASEGHKTRPSFSPDGTQIAVQMDLPEKQIYVIDVEGNSPPVNISQSSFGDRYPTWSPDGTQIAFTSVRQIDRVSELGELRQIWLMSADGSNQRLLTEDDIDSRHAHWSPRSNLIAFDRMTDHGRQIFVIEPDGSNLRQVTQTADNGYAAFC